ncbi:hypothetical protein NDU88_001239 [Pleurodeles waltl]|uniref:Uncharacterized protein n=1 Tax=Pleurodeles waltl TaxID=8319 RepID=A0AAV7THA4_PLEWA|nr:hypothetical protein NDU88_001239 [Pleurodeles waltl]
MPENQRRNSKWIVETGKVEAGRVPHLWTRSPYSVKKEKHLLSDAAGAVRKPTRVRGSCIINGTRGMSKLSHSARILLYSVSGAGVVT